MAGNSAQPDADEEKKAVFRKMFGIGLMDGLLSGCLFICGIVGISYGGGHYSGPPYYTGAFITGSMFLVKSLLVLNLYRRGSSSTLDNISARQPIMCTVAISVFCFMGCIIGVVMTAASGIFGSCDRDFFPENDIACDANYGKYKSVAIGVIILIVCCAVLNIYTFIFMRSTTLSFAATNGRSEHIIAFNLGTQRQLEIQNAQLAMQNQMLMNQMAASQNQNYGGHQSQHYGGLQNQNYGGHPPGLQNYTGTQLGPGVYDVQSQEPGAFGTITPPTYPISNTLDVKMDLNEPSVEPTAPPPSYDEITKQ